MATTESPVLTPGSEQTLESAGATADQSSASGGNYTPEVGAAAAMKSDSVATTKPPYNPASNSPPDTISAPAAAANFPPPKTDKPRPHVCTTCMRSFARLEHLKRHERSHTKEKPFECPSCTRCFARRDLLLRHQQKLHSTTTPSSRPRNGRRESTTGVATGRVRKNSMASTPTTNMRPRANTLSHVDASSAGLTGSGGFARQFASLHSHHNSFSGAVLNPSFGFRSLGMSGHTMSGLPRLDTHSLSSDMSSGLRTAPPYGGFGADFDMTLFDAQDIGNTINPHALHMHGQSPYPLDNSWDASQHMYIGMPTGQTLTEEDGFDWVTHGFETQMNFTLPNETAIDDSSPSAMSTNSPAHFNEPGRPLQPYMDGTGQSMGGLWPQNISHASQMVNSPLSMDVSSFFGEMPPPGVDTISPKSLLAQKTSGFDNGFPTPPDLTTMDPSALAGIQHNPFGITFKNENIASTASTASMDSSLRNGSVATTSTDLVTEHVRNVLIAGLNHSSGFGQRKQSQPSISSPLSPTGSKQKHFSAANFPSTQELQRYVSAYINYYHPHLPFLHIPTLNFESLESNLYRPANAVTGHSYLHTGPGGSCLMLSISALGALFENEMTHSRELFECAKRLISSYLEERRRSQTGKSQFLPHQRADLEDTPLWLVQAMLLNVIYGHNCGDKQAADIASNHCAALVSLARGAELAKPYPTYLNSNGSYEAGPGLPNIATTAEGWNTLSMDTSDHDWYEWKNMEERKRTLYAVFVLSSMLVTAYNRAPALTNSEIRLDLPCDEELWSAGSAHTWRGLGGVAGIEARSVQFASALTHLLTAAQRQRRGVAEQMAGEPWQDDASELRPSSFGCLVLINALHNYIWETRQRHLGRQWTPQEIDSMHAHIEPALRAWQSAWHSNPTHAVERPNPFGAGPLSADSIPLLDLAYVRLFVDFGRSKEAYWQRDYDAMARELAGEAVVANHHVLNPRPADVSVSQPHVQVNDNILEPHTNELSADASGSRPTQRERHLRKAAFYAADHLLASDRLGLSLSQHNARELPIQSVLCACDSAQVLAEWATTVQERVGKYIGVIGRDDIDFTQVPAALLLDDEDRKLLGTIRDLLEGAESKHDFGAALRDAREGGYGSQILVVTSEIMIRAAVWPVTKHMARCLEIQSTHAKARAATSVQV